MAKKHFKKSNRVGMENRKVVKKTIEIVERGETLAESIIGVLSLTATGWAGIGSATYGLARAWAALKVVAKVQGIEVEDLFSGLTDSFSKEFEEILTEAEI